MGTKDKTTRRLEECNDVFADIINVLVFNGDRQVREEDLVDVDTKSEFMADDKGLRSQDRDVAKFWTAKNVRIALFGLENQSNPDSMMPLRIFSYNGASYKAQIIPDKKDKVSEVATEPTPVIANDPKQPLYPVLTLVLYFGLTPWNTAKTLYEAIDIPDAMKPFIQDLSINLVEVAWLDDEVIDKFQSDFQTVAWFFKQYRIHGNAFFGMKDPKLIRKIKHVLEIMRLLSAYTGDPQYETLGIKHAHNKEVTMLAALKEYHEEIENKGRTEGRKEGRRDITTLFTNLFKAGRANDVQRAVEDPAYLDQIMAEFGYEVDGGERAEKPEE